LNYSNNIIAGNFDRATNLHSHPNPTDFAHEIRIRRIRILAGSITSLNIIYNFSSSLIVWSWTCRDEEQCWYDVMC